ncbi:MAG: VOC family protein [Rhizobiaceae bacterium]|nr:VOC family protein [Rhizobiaceae bacterium]
MQVQPYLLFNGNCREAFETYHRILGGQMQAMLRQGDAPTDVQAPEDMKDKIMHACLVVDGDMLMASDVPPQYSKEPGGFSVSLQVDSASEAERIFNALADGGNVTMALSPTFWAESFGMLVDRFGTPWIINYAGSVKFEG